jgi:hypothetical protein
MPLVAFECGRQPAAHDDPHGARSVFLAERHLLGRSPRNRGGLASPRRRWRRLFHRSPSAPCRSRQPIDRNRRCPNEREFLRHSDLLLWADDRGGRGAVPILPAPRGQNAMPVTRLKNTVSIGACRRSSDTLVASPHRGLWFGTRRGRRQNRGAGLPSDRSRSGRASLSGRNPC